MISKIQLDSFRERYRGKRALVTGGFGSIGAFFALILTELGCHVTLLDTDTTPDRASLINLEPGLREQCTIIQGSIADETLMRALIAEGRFQFVLNFAAHASFIEAAARNPLETFRSNAFGAAALLETLRRCPGDLEWVFQASTDKVYGDSEEGAYDEDETPLCGRGLYDVSKVAADLFFSAYRRAFSLPTITLRLCNLYGPFEFGRTADYRIVPKTLKALFGSEIPAAPELYYDSLGHSRDYLHIQDFARAVLMLGQSSSSIGEVFNLPGYHASTPEIGALTVDAALKVADLYDPLRAEQIRANGLRIPLREGAPQILTITHQSAGGEKIARATGFRPEIPLAEGLLDTAEFYFEHYQDRRHRRSQRESALIQGDARLPVCMK